MEGLLGVVDLVTVPFSAGGEKEGQGMGGELLRILFENRRGMAEDVADGDMFRRAPESLSPSIALSRTDLGVGVTV